MEKLVERLIKGEGYRFAEPWRVSSKALSFVVPIILENPTGKRDYVVAEEVKDKLKLKDSGRISDVKVRNNTDKFVFFRGGGLLKGVGTQSRAVEYDVVVAPAGEELIKVLCVHASHPIAPGSNFQVSSDYAPRPVFMALMSGNQGMTWNAVNRYSAWAENYSRGLTGETVTVPSDNLVETLETVSNFRREVKKKLEKIPGTLENQVGIVVIDFKGVVGLELYDHPDSWKAFSDSVIRQYEDVLVEEAEAGLFRLDEEKIVPTIVRFLEKAKDVKKQVVYKKSFSRTVAVKGDEITGQYTTLNGEIIHLILAREEEEFNQQSRRLGSQIYYTTSIATSEDIRAPYTDTGTPSFYTEPSYMYSYFSRRGAWDFLSEIERKPKTWKDLEPKFRSTVTLSRRAKEAVAQGLAEKTFRPTNGRTIYRITAKGKEALKKARQCAAQY